MDKMQQNICQNTDRNGTSGILHKTPKCEEWRTENRPRLSSFSSQYNVDDAYLLQEISADTDNKIQHQLQSPHGDGNSNATKTRGKDKDENDRNGTTESRKQEEEEETWFILCVVVPCNMLLGMFWISFPILYIEFADFFGASKGVAGFIGSIQNGLQQFLGLITSSPIELYGCRINALIGSVIVVCGIILSSFAPNVLWLYVTYGVVTGVGLSMLNLSCQVIIQQHFNRNRSISTAIAMIGKSMGQVVGPIVIQFLIHYFGWRGALLVFGAIFLNTFAFAIGFRPPKNRTKKAKGLKEVLRKIFDFSMLRDVAFVLFCLSFVLFKFTNMAFYRQLPSRMVFEGMDRQNAALILSITGLCQLIGRLISGFIGNFRCVNRTAFYALAVFSTGVLTCVLVLSTTFVYTSVISGFNGAATGTTTLMANIVLVDLFGADKIARSKGLFNVISASAGFLATPLTGLIFDVTGNYSLPFLVAGCLSLVGGCLATSVYCIQKQRLAAKRKRDKT